jgi:hypothetical protein
MMTGGPGRLTSNEKAPMKFVEMTGATLLTLADDDQLDGLRAAGVSQHSKIRVNPQGDIEILKGGHWSIIGGLLGDFQRRIQNLTGHNWS